MSLEGSDEPETLAEEFGRFMVGGTTLLEVHMDQNDIRTRQP